MFDPTHIIQTVGVVGIVLIVLLESGVFFAFFLPGDTLLFTAGLLASQGVLPFFPLVVGCAVAAVLGDSIGYLTGLHMGRRLFEKEAGFLFKKKRIYEAEHFYKKHGKYTIIIARFIPVIRTFAPIVAGVGKMHYLTFISYNIWGGVGWAILILSLGYFFGSFIPNPDTYILPIILLILCISAIPLAYRIIIHRLKKSK